MTGKTVIATCTTGLGKSADSLRSKAQTRSASPRTRSTPPPLDEPGCNPMTTRTSARTRTITLIAAALLAVGGCASDPATAPTTTPVTPADTAAAFAAAYPQAAGPFAGRRGPLAADLAEALRDDHLAAPAQSDGRWPTFAASRVIVAA